MDTVMTYELIEISKLNSETEIKQKNNPTNKKTLATFYKNMGRKLKLISITCKLESNMFIMNVCGSVM